MKTIVKILICCFMGSSYAIESVAPRPNQNAERSKQQNIRYFGSDNFNNTGLNVIHTPIMEKKFSEDKNRQVASDHTVVELKELADALGVAQSLRLLQSRKGCIRQNDGNDYLLKGTQSTTIIVCSSIQATAQRLYEQNPILQKDPNIKLVFKNAIATNTMLNKQVFSVPETSVVLSLLNKGILPSQWEYDTPNYPEAEPIDKESLSTVFKHSAGYVTSSSETYLPKRDVDLLDICKPKSSFGGNNDNPLEKGQLIRTEHLFYPKTGINLFTRNVEITPATFLETVSNEDFECDPESGLPKTAKGFIMLLHARIAEESKKNNILTTTLPLKEGDTDQKLQATIPYNVHREICEQTDKHTTKEFFTLEVPKEFEKLYNKQINDYKEHLGKLLENAQVKNFIEKNPGFRNDFVKALNEHIQQSIESIPNAQDRIKTGKNMDTKLQEQYQIGLDLLRENFAKAHGLFLCIPREPRMKSVKMAETYMSDSDMSGSESDTEALYAEAKTMQENQKRKKIEKLRKLKQQIKENKKRTNNDSDSEQSQKSEENVTRKKKPASQNTIRQKREEMSISGERATNIREMQSSGDNTNEKHQNTFIAPIDNAKFTRNTDTKRLQKPLLALTEDDNISKNPRSNRNSRIRDNKSTLMAKITDDNINENAPFKKNKAILDYTNTLMTGDNENTGQAFVNMVKKVAKNTANIEIPDFLETKM